MIINSIRWRLQVWYALILVAVLAGFGITAYQFERGRVFQRIDADLRRHANALMNIFHPGPRGRMPPPDDFFPGRPARPLRPPQPPPREPPFDEGPPGAFADRRQGPDWRQRLADLFDESDTNGFYYVIFALDENGKELARSSNAPAGVVMFSSSRGEYVRNPPLRGNEPPPFHPRPPEPPVARMRESFREISLNPPGEVILVGRSVMPESGELRRFAWMLTGAGGMILLLGLAGGWWLAGRAIRPIEDISSTAVKIAAGDLAQRINVGDTENELGRLVGVLNSTFARLESAFAQQQQFTSDVAHELRTPVSVMLTQIQTTLGRERSPAEYRGAVEACERAAQRMRRLIESLLELARLEAGQEMMKRAPFDLARVAADGVELVQPLAAARGIAIHSDLTAGLCEGDAERIALVVTNLLTNAVHHNREGGEVRITTARENDSVVLTVADKGTGIAPEHLPHVFKRFYRADPARTAAQGRAGLGLAISKAVVDAHGGSIDVSSEPGAGAKFVVRLPAAMA